MKLIYAAERCVGSDTGFSWVDSQDLTQPEASACRSCGIFIGAAGLACAPWGPAQGRSHGDRWSCLGAHAPTSARVKPTLGGMVEESVSDAPLGPFQDIWEAWEEVGSDIVGKPLSHFRRAIEIQFDELDGHLARANRDAAAREVIDMISIALNTMRWLGYGPAEIAEIARIRARQRMRGQVRSILDKYEDRYGI